MWAAVRTVVGFSGRIIRKEEKRGSGGAYTAVLAGSRLGERIVRQDRACNRSRKQGRDRIPDKAILGELGAVELEAVREALEPGGLPHCEHTILIRMDVAAPVGIALCEQRAGEPLGRKTTVPFGVVRQPGSFHSCRQQPPWDVAPRSPLRDMLDALEQLLAEADRMMVENAR